MRRRRRVANELKLEAVSLAEREHSPAGQVARDPDLHEMALRRWRRPCPDARSPFVPDSLKTYSWLQAALYGSAGQTEEPAWYPLGCRQASLELATTEWWHCGRRCTSKSTWP
jgi:hypothetical protein